MHQCHIPYIGTPEEEKKCNDSTSCKPPLTGAPEYTSAEVDFYACLNQLDESVGVMLDALKANGYYENTMVWFTTGDARLGQWCT